jgi:hypothetical protein
VPLRLALAALLLALPAAHAAELAIRAVVVKSARVSTQKPIVVKAGSTAEVQVTVLAAERRIVFTP